MLQSSRGETFEVEIHAACGMLCLLPLIFPGLLPIQLKAVTRTELKLRIAQAEETLEGIRHEICHKSCDIYSTAVVLKNLKIWPI